MKKFAINANRRRVIKGVFIETVTILGWTVGSALHSIFTKNSFNKLSKDESISSRIIFGSFLTIIQLLLAAVTGILICGIINIIHRRREIKRDSVELVNNRIVIDGNDANIEGSITESTCENRFEQTDVTQISKSSSYIINDENVEISKENNEFNEFNTNLNMDENVNINYSILNKEYNLNTFNRNINFSAASFEIGSNYENEPKKDKLISINSNKHQQNAYNKPISKERWWGSNKMLFSAALYAIANICANTALGGGKVMLVQIIKCSELILTAILAFFVLKRKVTIREVIAFSISTVGIILVVTSTLSNGNAGSKVIIYSVILAGVGAFTISLRNVIVSSANKNEKAVDTFTILSFWGMVTSLTIFSIMSIAFGGFNINVSVTPLLISGCFHATYNFSSLAFLKLVGSPIVHAYFNLAKRAIIVLTAELINCTAPPIVQIFGSILAILGIHFSKKRKLLFKSKKKITADYINEIQNENTDFNGKLGKVINEKPNEAKVANKDKYPYAASIAISSLFIIIGWITSYTCSCVLPKKSTTPMGEIKHGNSSFINLEKNNQKFKNEIKKIFEIDNWFNNYPEILLNLSENKPKLLSESMRKYTRISENFFVQGEIMMSILNYTVGNVENGIVFGLADHENKGDAGINWSQYLVFNRLNIKIIYYCTSNNSHKPCDFNKALKIANSLPQKPTIFLTGGGNLGDVWPKYENERKKILREFRGFNTIIFPQSISLKSRDSIIDFDYLKMHKNLTIFVRDIYSYDFLHNIFKNQNTTNTKLFLTPDIVTSIMSMKEKKVNYTKHSLFNEIYDILWISRNDREISNRQWNNNYETNLNIKIDDWIKFSPTSYSKGILYGKKYVLKNKEKTLSPKFVSNYVFNSTYECDEPNFDVFSIGISLQRFCAGLNFILQGKVIISNRLHGHIFSSLLNKNQVLLDTKKRCIGISRKNVQKITN
ncbi:integral membrane with 10 transmembrane domains [Cryptosporidium sp. chipmunk genotype I]|uniref:integral membrane with 10 transmembrane domains n=1 Tax=Cryptosporidium sp. chipmunk genotype I TaxID=1280935 RepID=UPI003519F50A|nr:integral membrane with 10 transmembrane domains [Cryptosporidium sp. chipmunk genotype I]